VPSVAVPSVAVPLSAVSVGSGKAPSVTTPAVPEPSVVEFPGSVLGRGSTSVEALPSTHDVVEDTMCCEVETEALQSSVDSVTTIGSDVVDSVIGGSVSGRLDPGTVPIVVLVVGNAIVAGPDGAGVVVLDASRVVDAVVSAAEVDDSITVGGVGPGPVLGGVASVDSEGAVVGVVGRGRCGVVMLGPAGATVVLLGGVVVLVVAEVSSGKAGGSVSRVCTAAVAVVESLSSDPSSATRSL
jgi:hypothetical protein